VTDAEQPVSDELQLAGKVVQELGPAAADFAMQATGSARFELAELIAGPIRLRRHKSDIRRWRKAQQIAEEAGLPASSVPVKVWAPLLAYAALEGEDDQDMQARWDNLLANATTDSVAEVPPAFPEVLRQLEPLDAKILETLAEHARGAPPPAGSDPEGLLPVLIERDGELPEGSVTPERTQNLVRLNLVYLPLEAPTFLGKSPVVQRGDIALTPFGAAFFRACQRPEPKPPQTS
jgi:hypothetical protein